MTDEQNKRWQALIKTAEANMGNERGTITVPVDLLLAVDNELRATEVRD